MVWIEVDPGTLALGPFHWFGAPPHSPAPRLRDGLARARRTTPNPGGVKPLRRDTFVLSKARCECLDLAGLADRLFPTGASAVAGSES